MTKKVKVLAVEDDEAHRLYMAHHLEAAGFEVILADDGDVALQKLSASPDIAVILLDRKMPRMNGIAVLEKIMLTPELKNIPVILQTALAATGRTSEELLAGVVYDAYLTKPYDGDKLVSVVRDVLKNSKRVVKEQ